MTAPALAKGGPMLQALGWLLTLVPLAAEALRAPLEPDEWQHLTVTADIARGLPEYVATWDNHSHALHRGLARLLDPDLVVPGQVVRARLLTVAATAMTALLLRGPSRAMGLSGWQSDLASVVFLLSGPALAFGFQVRPDAYAGLLLTGSLALLCASPIGGVTRGAGRTFLAGLVAGLACAFSVKALIGIAGLALALAACTLREPSYRSRLQVLLFGLGVGVGGLLWIALGVPSEAQRAFVDIVVLGNARSLDRFRASLPFEHGILLGAAALGFFVRPASPRAREAKQLISVAAAVPTLLYLLVTPAPYPQTLILVAPACALLATLAIDGVLRPLPSAPLRRIVAGLLFLAVVAPGVRKAIMRASRTAELHERFRQIAVVEALVPPGSSVLSGYGFVYSRPHALPYAALVKEVQLRLMSSPDPLRDLVESLERHPPALVWWDERLDKLGPSLEEFVAKNYQPLEPSSLILRRRGETTTEANGSPPL